MGGGGGGGEGMGDFEKKIPASACREKKKLHAAHT